MSYFALPPATYPARQQEWSPPVNVRESTAILPVYDVVVLAHETARRSTKRSLTDHRYLSKALNELKWYYRLLKHPAVRMIGFLLCGTVFATTHHVYYLSLSKKVVDDSNIGQEWATTIGITLVLLARCFWAAAVKVAHLQMTYLSLHQTSMSVKGIGKSLKNTSDLIALWNLEALRNCKLASLMALLVWFLPISTIIAPASLTVQISEGKNVTKSFEQYYIDFNNGSRFANTASSTNERLQFISYNLRTLQSTLATASNGEIQSSNAPYLNSTYSSIFYGPALQCTTPDDPTRTHIQDVDQREPDTNEQQSPETTYFAFVPARGSDGEMTQADVSHPPVDLATLGNWASPLFAGIWLKVKNGMGGYTFSACSLMNTSFTTEYSFHNGVQEVKIVGKEYKERLEWQDSLDIPGENQASEFLEASAAPFTFQAIFLSLAQQLTGRIRDNSHEVRVSRTSILASSELQGRFDNELGFSATDPSARRTTAELIEELSQNVTLSLFSSSSFLSPVPTAATLTSTDLILTFCYIQSNLYLSYGLSLLFVILALGIGLYAYSNFGHITDQDFATVLRTTHSTDLDRVQWHALNEEALGAVKLRLRNGDCGRRRLVFVLADSAGAGVPLRTVRYG